MNRKILNAGVMSLVIGVGVPVVACIGSSQGVSFQRGDGDTLTVRMKDSFTGQTRELVDDVGYLGMHLGMLKLKASARAGHGSLDPSRERAVIQFIHARAEVFEKVIRKYVPGSEGTPILESLAGFRQKLNSPSEDFKPLQESFLRLEKIMEQAGVTATTRVRESGAGAFTDEISLRDAKVPAVDAPVTRSACSSGIAEFNTSVDAGAPAGNVNSLPSFDVRQ